MPRWPATRADATPPEALEDLEGPKEPDPPVIEEPDDPRSVYSVLLDCCSLDEDLLRYLIDVLQRNADKEFQKLALVTTRKAFPPEALLEWLAGLESRATREELICSAVMDACLDRLASEDQKELMAALLSGDRKTFELFRCEARSLYICRRRRSSGTPKIISTTTTPSAISSASTASGCRRLRDDGPCRARPREF